MDRKTNKIVVAVTWAQLLDSIHSTGYVQKPCMGAYGVKERVAVRLVILSRHWIAFVGLDSPFSSAADRSSQSRLRRARRRLGLTGECAVRHLIVSPATYKKSFGAVEALWIAIVGTSLSSPTILQPEIRRTDPRGACHRAQKSLGHNLVFGSLPLWIAP